MLPALSPIKISIALLTLPISIAVVTLFMRSPSWFWQPGTIPGVWCYEVLAFTLVGLFGCMIAPKIPFITAAEGLLGVVLGLVMDLIVRPTIEGGVERNLFPLELAFHVTAATVGFGALAIAWKVGGDLMHD